MNAIKRVWWTAKGVGWDNLHRRVLQMIRIQSGWLAKKMNPENFSDDLFRRQLKVLPESLKSIWEEKSKRFFEIPTHQQLSKIADDELWHEHVETVCQKALHGEYQFFSHWYGELGWPPNFNKDPMHNIDWPVGEHWMKTAKSGPPRHDIKLVWEPSRFTLAYHFGRAYVRTNDEKWAKAFWEMFDAWVEQNPVQMTVNWGCGQENAFRLMAMLFGAFTTLKSPWATNDRLYALSCFAWQTAKQISININYARSQKNNHAFSEALGLWTVGFLFPEFERSRKWLADGEKILAAESARQIYDDGSFVQHSMNYHRVMLDDLAWVIALAKINKIKLDSRITDRFRRATDWLVEFIDPVSGRVPNYGANDGANVLPLTCCGYLNYRPVAQACYYLAHGKRLFDVGPWDEKMLWLCGENSLASQKENKTLNSMYSANNGGYYIIRGENSWMMTRCHTYKDRPSQCDMLHVDLWYKGSNILRDAGSYMYYCEEPLKSYFSSTAAHNTVEIDGENQMTKGPRFLWFDWTKSKLLEFNAVECEKEILFSGEHYGYKRLKNGVTHRRTIEQIMDVYEITDEISGPDEHDIRLGFNLADIVWKKNQLACQWQGRTNESGEDITIHVSMQNINAEVKLDCSSDSNFTKESLYYGELENSPKFSISMTSKMPIQIKLLIGPSAMVNKFLSC